MQVFSVTLQVIVNTIESVSTWEMIEEMEYLVDNWGNGEITIEDVREI
jgi:hypothetical protein